MSVTEALGRIDQIQSRLLQLTGADKAPPPAAPVSPQSSAAFADTLARTLGTAAPQATGAAGGAVPANPGAATGEGIVATAKKYLGVPYVFGGEDSSGMDCSGLVQRVYADMGIEVPRLVSGQMKVGTEVASLAEARPGDLIVTGGGDHILIYAGDNKVIHAPYPGRTVSLVDAYMKESDITTIRRIIPPQSAPAWVPPTASPAGSADLMSSALAAAFSAFGGSGR